MLNERAKRRKKCCVREGRARRNKELQVRHNTILRLTREVEQ